MNDDHAIRLGPAWTLTGRTAGAIPRRIGLPATWDLAEDPVRLERAFGRPTRGVEGMAVALRLGRVSGLRAVRLNGSPLGFEADGAGGCPDVPIPDGLLLARNRLELDVDRRGLVGDEGGPWGEIALVFRPASAPLLGEDSPGSYNRTEASRP
ncbi:MAG: hypothetical protein U0800_01320 [Isosphaeraceae bacterium]